MNVIKTKLDVEVTLHFEDDGSLIVEVYQGDAEEPTVSKTLPMYSLVKEYYECVHNPNTAKINDVDAVEMAYNIIDEMQDCIDFLNDVIEDHEDE